MKSLLTISMLVDLDDETEAAALVRSVIDAWQIQIAAVLEQHGRHADELDGLLVNYGVAVSFPQPLLEQDPR